MCGSKTFKPISEMRYRNSLEQLTGKRSCSELTEEQLQKVYNLFKSIGFKTVQTRFDPAREQSRALRNIRASITDRAPDILGSSWERRLQGFIRKMGKEDLSFCDHNELRKVQGFLSREEKKEKEKAE
jgi:phage gp16-like protein